MGKPAISGPRPSPAHMKGAHRPAHLRIESLEGVNDPLRVAGRRFLHGVLSVALVASLVPTIPTYAVATDGVPIMSLPSDGDSVTFELIDPLSSEIKESYKANDIDDTVVIDASDKTRLRITVTSPYSDVRFSHTDKSVLKVSEVSPEGTSEPVSVCFTPSDDGASCEAMVDLADGTYELEVELWGVKTVEVPPSEDPDEPQDESGGDTGEGEGVDDLHGTEGEGQSDPDPDPTPIFETVDVKVLEFEKDVLVDTAAPMFGGDTPTDSLQFSNVIEDDDDIAYINNTTIGRSLTLVGVDAEDDDSVTVIPQGVAASGDAFKEIKTTIGELRSSEESNTVHLAEEGYYTSVIVRLDDSVHDPVQAEAQTAFVVDGQQPQAQLELTVNGKTRTYNLADDEVVSKLKGDNEDAVYLNGSDMKLTISDESFGWVETAFDAKRNAVETSSSNLPDDDQPWQVDPDDKTKRTLSFSLDETGEQNEGKLVIPVSDRAKNELTTLELGGEDGMRLVVDNSAPAIRASYVDGDAPAGDSDVWESIDDLLKEPHAHLDEDLLPFLQQPVSVRVVADDANLDLNPDRSGVVGPRTGLEQERLAFNKDGIRVVTYDAGDHQLLPEVVATDKAGNASVPLKLDEPFVVDPDKPDIQIGKVAESVSEDRSFVALDETTYINDASAKVSISARDRALNTVASFARLLHPNDDPNMATSVPEKLWSGWTKQEERSPEDGKFDYAAAVFYPEDGRYVTPSVFAVDIATNEAVRGVPGSAEEPESFVIDTLAPQAATSFTRGHDDGTPDTNGPALDPNNDQGLVQAKGYAATVDVEELNWPTAELFRAQDGLVEPAVGVYDEKSFEVTPFVKLTDWVMSSGEGTQTNTAKLAIGKNLPDGVYHIVTEGTDLAGNKIVDAQKPEESEVVSQSFILDNTAPRIDVAWGDEVASNESYYSEPRTVTLCVTERNFNPSNAEIEVEGKVFDGSAYRDVRSADYTATDWKRVGEDGSIAYESTLTFALDGEYRLSVSGADLALNEASVYRVADDGTTTNIPYAATSFVVDQTDPEVSITYPEGENAYKVDGGLAYFRTPTDVTIEVTDRNFDPDKTEVDTGGDGTTSGWELVSNDPDSKGNFTWRTSVSYGEGTHAIPEVRARDLAYRTLSDEEGGGVTNETVRNQTDAASATNQTRTPGATSFVVDLTAPQVSSAAAADPVSMGDGQNYWFYNGPTSVTLSVQDNYPLKQLLLADKDGVYDRRADIAPGGTSASVVVSLEDGEGRSLDTEFDRKGDDDKITLLVEDVAGNTRIWRLSRDGTVDDYAQSDPLDVTISGKGIYPLSLIKDVSAPIVGISGVAAGSYSNTTQVAHVSVHELNYAYLQRFAPNTSVLRVTRYEGNAGRAASSFSVPASAFVGTGSDYGFDQSFAEDGHYVLEAGFSDYAHNRSNVARVGEFTIDKTAPVLEVSFDNNDVRNGKYYNAARTATITVQEHNFDASLFSIETNGSVGGWSSSGDTHTCTVSFATDGVYNLSVSGTDLAGNAATPYVAEEFVVDLVAPTIDFGGIFGDHELAKREGASDGEVSDATNGVVAPTVTFADEANFDANAVSYEIAVTGTVGKAVPTSITSELETQTGTGQSVGFGGFEPSDGYVAASDTTDSDDGEGVDTSQVPGDFPHTIDVDDVYTITASVSDLAGNATQDSITFSVNRFGSNFVIEKPVAEGDDPADLGYISEAPEIVIHEINVVEVADSKVTSTHDLKSVDLPRNSRSGQAGYVVRELADAARRGWHEYEYTIARQSFMSGGTGSTPDGNYIVFLSSTDATGNTSTSSLFSVPMDDPRESNVTKQANATDSNATLKTAAIDSGNATQPAGLESSTADDLLTATERPMSAAVKFTLDTTDPEIIGLSVEDGQTYSSEGSYLVTFTAADNIGFDEKNGIKILADEKEVPFEVGANGKVSFYLEEKPFTYQSLRVIITDYAQRVHEIILNQGVKVTSDIFDLYMPFIIAGAVAVAGLGIAGGTALLRRSRKKQQASG